LLNRPHKWLSTIDKTTPGSNQQKEEKEIPIMKDRNITFTATLLAVACFAFLPKSLALNPPPDGGYAGGNTAEGQNALLSLTGGTFNTAIGSFSLKSTTTGKFNTATGADTLFANTGDQNTATGAGTLFSNTTGTLNTANGAFALFSNTVGSGNNAFGNAALFGNTTGGQNTAIGDITLHGNTTGSSNTANGAGALNSNTTGDANTATGVDALLSNTTASENTGVGAFTLQNNTTGGTPGGSGTTEVGPNTAIGGEALFSNTTGGANTAVGFQALHAISDKSESTAVGFKALANSINNNDAFGYKALGNNTTGFLNTAIGDIALFNNTTGAFNVALGAATGASATTGTNNIYIGFGVSGVVGESNACYIGSIFNATSAGGTPVFINTSGKLGTLTSSARFKEEIKPMEKASEALLALKPVTFRYKKEIDATGRSQFGLVAEDVEKVNPDLVVRDKEGKPYSVRYDQVNAMLLNEFLKEHRKVQALEASAAQQQKQIEALTAGLQKVSAQLAAASPSRGGLEASKPAPQVVSNP
jgi:trimeric autotransporter adhesin